MRQEEIIRMLSEMALNRCTPENITSLNSNEVFVFGSKPDGHHLNGAAKYAVEKFGAIEGKAEGIAGQSYAIPVHRHRIEIMEDAISRFIEYARAHKEQTFYVLPIGCGNANMDVSVVANMFKASVELENVCLPAVFIKSIKRCVVIPEDEPLPIVYVDEIINADCLRGRMMGLMAEISKRTEQPITFEDDVLKKDNIMLFAFLRIAKVVKKEEQRVMNALMDEAKRMSETELGKVSDNGTIRALEFVRGWKLEANKIFEEGGSIYDLLRFTNPNFTQNIQDKLQVKGSHEKLGDGHLKVFEENGKQGLKNSQDVVIIPAAYEKITSAGWSGRGWHLKKDEKWGAVNELGEWIFDVEYDEIKVRYEGGHFLRKNGKMGFCNSEGVLTIDYLYDELENYSSSWDGAKAKLDKKWGYVDGGGNVVVPIEYDYIDLDANGMIKVKKDGKYGFYNKKDGLVISIEYEQAYGFTSSNPNESVVQRGNTWGVINTKGETVIPFEYESVSIDAPNVYRVKKDGLSGIIDKSGKTLFPFKYKDLGAFDKDGVTFAANESGLYGYVDKEDTIIIPFSYQNARNFDGNYAEVSMGWDKNGVIDKKGNTVVPLQFNHVHIHWDDIIEVEKDDRENFRHLCGLYDLKNGYTLPCIYERINPMGRDREGILECECWKDRRGEPIKVKVNYMEGKQGRSLQHRETYYIRLSVRQDGQLEIVDIRKDLNTVIGSWQKTNGTNYIGQIEDIELSREDADYLWIKTECVNQVLYLPKSIGSEEIIGFVSFGCWTDRSPIKGLVVPEGYKYIGGEAFMAHPTLEFVSLPDGLYKIEQSAFTHCPNLRHVFLGKPRQLLFFQRHPLSIIENLAFDNCHPSLTFYIPSGYEGRPYDRERFQRVEFREHNEERIISSYQNCIANLDVTSRRIAIARDFAVVIKDNEWELELIGHNQDFRQLCRSTKRKFVKVAAGFDGYMALTDDGRIIAGPRAREFERGTEIEQLRDVVDVVGCEGHTVALYSDGTVSCVDEPGSYEGPENFAREVKDWNNIIQVSCGFDFVAGLKSDGTLISVGHYYRCPDWRGVVQFDAFNCYYGQIYTIALLDNGRVIADYTDEVSQWKDVIRVCVGNHGFAVGLKSDGTAYALGNHEFVNEVQSWRNIIDIECKFNHAVAILSNSIIVSAGF